MREGFRRLALHEEMGFEDISRANVAPVDDPAQPAISHDYVPAVQVAVYPAQWTPNSFPYCTPPNGMKLLQAEPANAIQNHILSDHEWNRSIGVPGRLGGGRLV